MRRFRCRSVEVLQSLHERFPGLVAPEVHSATVVHKDGCCFLDISRLKSPQTGSDDQTIDRHDINSWYSEEEKVFDPELSAFETARRLVEMVTIDVFAVQTNLLRTEIADRVLSALSQSRHGEEYDLSLEELTAGAIAELIEQGHKEPPKWFLDISTNL